MCTNEQNSTQNNMENVPHVNVQQSPCITQNYTENVPQVSLCHLEILCTVQSYPSVYGAYFPTHIGPPCSLYLSPISMVHMVTILLSNLVNLLSDLPCRNYWPSDWDFSRVPPRVLHVLR
jgi:hypothetical protein